MALIVGGTTVTGTQTLDATKLTGNLPAINGASLTNLPSSATVFSSSAVGSFTFAKRTNTSIASLGTCAGSNLVATDHNGNNRGGIFGGTYRNMSGLLGTNFGTVYHRIS